LHFGATLVLSTAHASAEQVIELVRQHRCSVWVSTPSFVTRFLREDGFVQDDLVSLRKFVFCGEVLPLQTARNLAKKFCLAEIINSYGPTEGTVACTRIVISKSLLDSDGPLPVGYPMRTSAVGLLRESGNIDFSPDAEAGEIVIFGPNVAHGYLGDCVTSADKFFTHCGQRAFRTGDVGYMKDGVLHFSGRKEGFVKLNGFRIELDEIARRMECINGVAQACAFPILRDGEVRRIVAVYTRDESRKQCVENVEISLALRESLPTYMVPSEVIAVDAMPLTRNGKVDVGALRAVVSGITRRT
jgi:D-alanine--poly(phosphoribitol) ligase subunit 1